MIRENTRPLRWHYEISKEELVPEATASREIKKKSVLDLPGEIKNLHWIAGARREETRNKRFRQMLEELKAGNLYMNMEYTRTNT